MKKKFFSTRSKLTAIAFTAILLLEAIALPLGFAMLTNSELKNESTQKEAALDSLSTTFSESVVGDLLEYDYNVFSSIFDKYKDVTLTPNSDISNQYFIDFEKAKENFIGMTQAGTFRNIIMSALKTTLIPSSSTYLYLAVYDPSINIALVSMGVCIEGDNIFNESVKEGYYFKYDYPKNDDFKILNYKYNSPSKGEIFANVKELTYKKETIIDDDSLRFLVISEVQTGAIYSIVNQMMLKYFFITLLTSLILLILFVLLTHFFFYKKIKKISSLSTKKTQEMKNGNFEKYFKHNEKRVIDEIDVLNDDLYYLEEELHNYILKVEENIKISEKNRIEDELSHKIQLSSLPSKIVHDRNISITPTIKPAKAVGGDLYDYFYIDNNRFAFFIGDVSGKGVPAALFMMKAITLIKYSLMTYGDLLDAIKYVNEQLLIDNDASLFITAFIGVMDINENKLTYINAGHEKPIIDKGNGYEYLNVKPNLPLGICKEEYEKEYIPLKENDTLFLYTDGVSEAKDDNDNLYGGNRIIDILNRHRFDPKFIINYLILESVENFQCGHEQDDDICMLTFKYKPAILTIDNDVKELKKVNNFISEKTKFIKDTKIKSEMNIIIDEIVSNIIHYAYEEKGTITIVLTHDEHNIYLHFLDNGKHFDPFMYVSKRKEDDIGGLGINLVKSLSSSYEYKYLQKHNYIKITKKYK